MKVGHHYRLNVIYSYLLFFECKWNRWIKIKIILKEYYYKWIITTKQNENQPRRDYLKENDTGHEFLQNITFMPLVILYYLHHVVMSWRNIWFVSVKGWKFGGYAHLFLFELLFKSASFNLVVFFAVK